MSEGLLPYDGPTLVPKWRFTLFFDGNYVEYGSKEKYEVALNKFIEILRIIYGRAEVLHDEVRGVRSGKLLLNINGYYVEVEVEKLV